MFPFLLILVSFSDVAEVKSIPKHRSNMCKSVIVQTVLNMSRNLAEKYLIY